MPVAGAGKTPWLNLLVICFYSLVVVRPADNGMAQVRFLVEAPRPEATLQRERSEGEAEFESPTQLVRLQLGQVDRRGPAINFAGLDHLGVGKRLATAFGARASSEFDSHHLDQHAR